MVVFIYLFIYLFFGKEMEIHYFVCLLCFYKSIYLFLAALGLHYCTWAFSSFGERGLLFVAVHGLLIAVAPLVAELGL